MGLLGRRAATAPSSSVPSGSSGGRSAIRPRQLSCTRNPCARRPAGRGRGTPCCCGSPSKTRGADPGPLPADARRPRQRPLPASCREGLRAPEPETRGITSHTAASVARAAVNALRGFGTAGAGRGSLCRHGTRWGHVVEGHRGSFAILQRIRKETQAALHARTGACPQRVRPPDYGFPR